MVLTAGHVLSRSARCCNLRLSRCWSSVTFDANQDDVAELFDRIVDKSGKQAERQRPLILTTRREALSLYRSVLRWSNLFVWHDNKGRVWRDVIRDSARKEFEEARYERDPEIVNRMIISGRDCVSRAVDNFLKQREKINQEEASRAPSSC